MKKLLFVAVIIISFLSLNSCGSVRKSDCGLSSELILKEQLNKETVISKSINYVKNEFVII